MKAKKYNLGFTVKLLEDSRAVSRGDAVVGGDRDTELSPPTIKGGTWQEVGWRKFGHRELVYSSQVATMQHLSSSSFEL